MRQRSCLPRGTQSSKSTAHKTEVNTDNKKCRVSTKPRAERVTGSAPRGSGTEEHSPGREGRKKILGRDTEGRRAGKPLEAVEM